MVLFILAVKADIEGISSVSLNQGANICLSLRNPLSDYETREKIVMDTSQLIEAEGREQPSHFAIKWDGSQKRSTMEVLDESAAKTSLKKKKIGGKKGGGDREMEEGVGIPRAISAEDSGTYVPVMALDCRGVEPYAFYPMGEEFVVTSMGGKIFNSDVDLSEGEWGEYDEENDMAVSISAFTSKFMFV